MMKPFTKIGGDEIDQQTKNKDILKRGAKYGFQFSNLTFIFIQTK